MKKRSLHICRFFALLMLCVFSIALAPWATLHHHEEEVDYCNKYGRACMHKAHINNGTHSCLVCSVHFEKDYVATEFRFRLIINSINVTGSKGFVSSSYTALISSSLRGPPSLTTILV